MSGLKPNEILATIQWTPGEGGPPLVITMGLTNVSGATAADINSLWQESVMFSATSLLHPDNLDDDYSFASFKVLLNRGGVLTADEIIDTSPGTNNVHSVPVRTCVNLQKVTGIASRYGRGRCFIPGAYTEALLCSEAGEWSSDMLTTLQNGADVWYARLNTTDSLHPAVLHLKDARAATPVTSFKIKPFTATIRHRQQRG